LIEFFNEDLEFSLLEPEKVKKWIFSIVELHGKELAELNFYFCSDEYLLNINRSELQHDFYTDVITFDNCIDDLVFGDIYISIDRVLENEKMFSDGKYPEILRIIIHGVLHLLGFKDKQDHEKKKMTENENLALDFYFKM
jgi:rRNA maturation RNase YbeY